MQKDHIINVHTNNKFQLRALKTDRDTKTYCNVNVCTNPFLLRGRSNTLLNFKRGKGLRLVIKWCKIGGGGLV